MPIPSPTETSCKMRHLRKGYLIYGNWKRSKKRKRDDETCYILPMVVKFYLPLLHHYQNVIDPITEQQTTQWEINKSIWLYMVHCINNNCWRISKLTFKLKIDQITSKSVNAGTSLFIECIDRNQNVTNRDFSRIESYHWLALESFL